MSILCIRQQLFVIFVVSWKIIVNLFTAIEGLNEMMAFSSVSQMSFRTSEICTSIVEWAGITVPAVT